MVIYKGKPVSPGIAVGAAYIFKPVSSEVFESYFDANATALQIGLYESAIQAADAELRKVIASFPESEVDQAKIFEAHLEILHDEEIDELVRDVMENDHACPDYAVQKVFGTFIALLETAKDPLIAARTADLRDVRNRLIRILHGEKEVSLARLDRPVIVVAHDLLPGDTATMDRENVLGIVTEIGGETSHSAILARSFGIPAVLGVPGATGAIQDGETLALDAIGGEIFAQPDEAALLTLAEKKRAYLREKELEAAYLEREPLTADGARVQIGINIGAVEPGNPYTHCDFVGLFRTEFLYMDNDHLPTEDEQFEAYKAALINAGGRPVTLRTLDIGGDKQLKFLPLAREENPFLGNRALRLCFSQPDLFRVQLRAALRASVHGELWIMLPMVGSMDDIRNAKDFIAGVKAELRAESVAFDEDVKVGIMIEIPSIAQIADLAALEVDFASIGSNDLCQYTCAVDRMNPSVSGYYQSFSPAMFRLMGYAIAQFNAAGKAISICGEMGGDPAAVVALLGLGLRKFSMSTPNIPRVKRALSRVSVTQAEALAAQLLNTATEAEIKERIAALLEREG